jgi:hypothetical protein
MTTKILKLKMMSTEDRQKLVFEWVKTGVLSLKEFKEICNESILVDNGSKYLP